MRTSIAISLLLLAGCAFPNAGVQSSAPRAQEATILVREEQNRVAALNRDYDALEDIWSEQLMVNNPGNQVAPNRDAVFAIFRSGVAHYSSYETNIESVRIDGDIAIVMGGETVMPIGNAPRAGQTVRRRFTNIWRNEAGTWRLWARHANVIAPLPM